MKTIKTMMVAAVAAAGLTLMGACSDADLEAVAPASGVTTVAVKDDRFEPRVIEVPAGATVTWRFQGQNTHDVTGAGFASEKLRSGSFAHRFDTPGTFDYRCTLHPGMTGRVVVRT
jgi:plastocyanin